MSSVIRNLINLVGENGLLVIKKLSLMQQFEIPIILIVFLKEKHIPWD